VTWLRRFVQFWYDFLVGDDWTVAAVVVLGVAFTAIVTHQGWNAWPVLPALVVATLGTSVWRTARAARRNADERS
jgi:hypothetical protein